MGIRYWCFVPVILQLQRVGGGGGGEQSVFSNGRVCSTLFSSANLPSCWVACRKHEKEWWDINTGQARIADVMQALDTAASHGTGWDTARTILCCCKWHLFCVAVGDSYSLTSPKTSPKVRSSFSAHKKGTSSQVSKACLQVSYSKNLILKFLGYSGACAVANMVLLPGQNRSLARQ